MLLIRLFSRLSPRFFCLFVGCALISGCFYNDDVPSNTATGEELYEGYCASCHHSNGVGKFILGVPATFAQDLSRAEVVKLIREGDPRYPDMPVFPQIKFSQAHKIALHMRKLERDY